MFDPWQRIGDGATPPYQNWPSTQLPNCTCPYALGFTYHIITFASGARFPKIPQADQANYIIWTRGSEPYTPISIIMLGNAMAAGHYIVDIGLSDLCSQDVMLQCHCITLHKLCTLFEGQVMFVNIHCKKEKQ
jgi:hypothetical protein